MNYKINNINEISKIYDKLNSKDEVEIIEQVNITKLLNNVNFVLLLEKEVYIINENNRWNLEIGKLVDYIILQEGEEKKIRIKQVLKNKTKEDINSEYNKILLPLGTIIKVKGNLYMICRYNIEQAGKKYDYICVTIDGESKSLLVNFEEIEEILFLGFQGLNKVFTKEDNSK